MLHQNPELVNQALMIIEACQAYVIVGTDPLSVRDACETFLLLANDHDPGYQAHLEEYLLAHENDAQLDLFDAF